MDILKSNVFKTVSIIVIVFMVVPFIFPDDASRAGASGREGIGTEPVIVSKNPLARFFDRIGKFYGFKTKKGDSGRELENEVFLSSFGKEGIDYRDELRVNAGRARRGGAGGERRDAASYEDNYDTATGNTAAYRDLYGSLGTSKNTKEYVRMDGKVYEVIQGADKKKYVLMNNKQIPFDELMASTVSKEDFEAAKRMAPHLSDQELVYAINYPGGVKAYLGSSEYGMFAHAGSPSMFGSASGGPGTGDKGSNLFGMGASGIAGSGGQIFGDKSGALSAKYNKAGKDGGSAAGAAVSAAATRQQKAAANAVGVHTAAEVAKIFGEPLVGENPQKVEARWGGGAGSIGGLAATPTAEQKKSDIPQVLLVASGNNITPDSEDTRKDMTEAYLGKGKDFEGVIEEDGKQSKRIPNAWVLPADTGNSPMSAFLKNNKIILGGDLMEKYNTPEVDNPYKSAKDIIAHKTEGIAEIETYVIDGTDKNGNPKAAPKGTYYYSVIGGLLSGKMKDGAPNGFVDFNNIKKDTALIIVSKANVAESLRNKGYNVAVFNKYAVTQKNLESFYTQTDAAVTKIVENSKNPEQQQLAKKEDVKDSLGKRI